MQNILDNIKNKALKHKRICIGMVGLIAILLLLSIFISHNNSYDKGIIYESNSIIADGSHNDYKGSLEFGNIGYDISEEYNGITDDTIGNVNSDNEKSEYTSNKKLVYSANIGLETLEFDNTMKSIKSRIDEVGGFLETEEYNDNSNWYYPVDGSNSKYGNREAFISVRVPSSKYDDFINGLSDIAYVVSKNSEVVNMTQIYNDNEAELKSYKNQLEVLQNMYTKCKTIKEMIEVQSRISDVNAEISKLETIIKNIDRDVDYSKVSIHLSEVFRYSNQVNSNSYNFIERVKNQFKDSWYNFTMSMENIIMWLISAIWYIIILAITIAIFILVKKRKAKTFSKNKINEDCKDTIETNENNPKMNIDNCVNGKCLTEK